MQLSQPSSQARPRNPVTARNLVNPELPNRQWTTGAGESDMFAANDGTFEHCHHPGVDKIGRGLWRIAQS